MLDNMLDLKSSKGDSNEKMTKLEDGQTKDGPTVEDSQSQIFGNALSRRIVVVKIGLFYLLYNFAVGLKTEKTIVWAPDWR